MALFNAQQSRLILGDFSLSAMLKGVTQTADTEMLDATCLTDTAKVFIPGKESATFSCDGLLDSDASATGQLAKLDTWKNATAVKAVSYAPRGFAIGNEEWMVGAYDAKLILGTTQGGLATFQIDGQADGLISYNGVSLHDLGVETGAANATSVDNGASSAGGGYGHLHVTAFSGFTSVTVTIGHSTDNISFPTLLTFSTASGITSERQSITGTVNRYLRAQVAVVGSGSVTLQVGFHRNQR